MTWLVVFLAGWVVGLWLWGRAWRRLARDYGGICVDLMAQMEQGQAARTADAADALARLQMLAALHLALAHRRQGRPTAQA